MKVIFRKMIKLYKSKGLKAVISKIINKFYFKEYLYKISIQNKYSYINNDYSLRQLNLKTLDEMILNYPDEIVIDKYNILKERLNSKDEISYIILKAEEIFGYFNVAYNDVMECSANVVINVSADSIYLFDDYTFIKHRRKGVHEFSVLSRLNIGRNAGRKYAYVAIVSGNIPSEKTYGKFLFKKVMQYSCFRIGKIRKSIKKVL